MIQPNKVLMICFQFFPTKGAGHVRSRKFAKYLGQFGWEPTVLTVTDSVDSRVTGPEREDMEGIKVVKARFNDPFTSAMRLLDLDPEKDTRLQLSHGESSGKGVIPRVRAFAIGAISKFVKNWVAFPDRGVTWIPFAVYTGLRELRRASYEVIYSSSPPPSSHIIAYVLKRLTGVPWVADYRDLWSQDPFLARSSSRRKAERFLEKRILRKADCLVTVNSRYLDMLLELQGGKKITVITNGYDPDDHKVDARDINDKLVLTYGGFLYQLKRDPSPVIRVLDRIVERGDVDENDVLIRLYSDFEPRLQDLRDSLTHKNILELNGLVPRDEILRKQKESTALLAILMDHPLTSAIHGSKVFEYFGAGRPIMVWAPHGGVIKDMVEKTGTGAVATSESELEEILCGWIKEFQETGTIGYEPDESELQKYNRKNLAGDLARVFDSVCETYQEN
ncbi:MAG: glycosyltransferase [Actinobacteria bacterium]|nr:glycosyltransferase [Actinomycetota bacterium]MCG2817471.1 glycosyltransferase [Actinomycetes bacterium]MBU4217954.1 glycosyltransferase [Actinomycetota bacterium]MBU4357932.1 glycosyltransferase [Actinomycetota bacterium]MBU4393017.1 glycosyltransferase [Actinomycetota bacterium]